MVKIKKLNNGNKTKEYKYSLGEKKLYEIVNQMTFKVNQAGITKIFSIT